MQTGTHLVAGPSQFPDPEALAQVFLADHVVTDGSGEQSVKTSASLSDMTLLRLICSRQRQRIPCSVAPASGCPGVGVLCTPRWKAVRARISSVEAFLTMHPALAHLHMPHAALTALHVSLAAGRAGECKLRVAGFSAGSETGAAAVIAWHEPDTEAGKFSFFPFIPLMKSDQHSPAGVFFFLD